MNQASSGGDEMRPEYDIRGGVRGKYLHRYTAAVTGRFVTGVVTTTTTGAVLSKTAAVEVGTVELGSTVTADAA